jgi:hypothetical protein
MDQSLFMIPLEGALDGIDDLQGDKNPEEPIKTMDTDAKVLSEQAMDHKNMKNGEWQRENGDKKKTKSSPPALLPRRSSRGGMVTKNPGGFYSDTTGGRTQNVFDLRRGRAWRI